MNTMDRINQLNRERLELFRHASNGRRGDPNTMAQIATIDADLAQLWERRRLERAGRLDGIDAVVDAVYQRTYGANYEETVRPSPVEEANALPLPVAA